MTRPNLTSGPWNDADKGFIKADAFASRAIANFFDVGDGGANKKAALAIPQLLEALEEIVKADEDATKALKEIYGIQPNEGALRLQSMARAALIAAGYTED